MKQDWSSSIRQNSLEFSENVKMCIKDIEDWKLKVNCLVIVKIVLEPSRVNYSILCTKDEKMFSSPVI